MDAIACLSLGNNVSVYEIFRKYLRRHSGCAEKMQKKALLEFRRIGWRSGARRSGPAISVAVNLSPIQFDLPDLVARVDALVDAAGVDPSRLMFEISETAAMQNIEKTSRTIERLQSRDYSVAIDDFGTGYSSLGYLQRFRFDQIKIDGSFMRDLDTGGQRGSALLSAVVTLARALQIEVVAECVETESQLRTLGELACDQMQGFLMSRPLPAAEFLAFLRCAADRVVVTGSACATLAG